MMITRLAPTPSGFLHEGNLYNFLFNWLWARVNGGKVLLRIDDADASRFRPAYLENIFRTLEVLELDWDLGPMGTDDFYKDWSQTGRMPLYKQWLAELRDKKLVFACACSRKDLAEAGNPLIYSGTCEAQGHSLEDADVNWRILLLGDGLVFFHDKWMGFQCVDIRQSCGSFVLRRRDGIPAYQLLSLADDLHFGITHVARGSDLILSTACQLWLAASLGKEKFLKTTFLHHPLLLDNKQQKLSKSAGNAKEVLTISKPEPEKLFGRFACFSGLMKNDAPMSLHDLLSLAAVSEYFSK
ncbi:MAG: glutamate--tRNA ligase family protein [Bacteroidota bacterium]